MLTYENSKNKIDNWLVRLKCSPLKLPLAFYAAFLIFTSIITKISAWGLYTNFFTYLTCFLGVVCFIIASFTEQKLIVNSRYKQIVKVLVGAILICFSILLGIPKGIGLFLIGCSFLFSINNSISITLIRAGTLSTITTFISLFLVQIIPTFHEMKWFTRIISIVLKVFGINSYPNGYLLNTIINGKTYSFAVTYEQTGAWYFIPAILIMLIIILNDFSNSKLIKTFSITIISSILYFILRYIILINIYVLLNDIQIFYSPIISLISWVPWFCIYYILLKGFNIKHQAKCIFVQMPTPINKGMVLKNTIVILLILISFCNLFIGNYYSFGNYKNGKIFIDEYHSHGWESVTQPLNTEEFLGQKSTYTYYSLTEYLRYSKDVEVITDTNMYEGITPNDILIIKTPTVDFTSHEISSIQNFVRDGGGLFLIGDHTNLFDMNRRLNEIAKPFNIIFRYDSTYDLKTTRLTNYDTNYNLYFPNIINNILTQYKFATSCSIKSGLHSKKIMIGNNLSSELLDMSHPNFFGDLSLSETEMFGLFEQCVAVEYGKGRVIAFSDSTTFSSYSVFLHDNPEFISSVIDYLDQTNRKNLFLIIGVVLLIVTIVYSYFIKEKILLRQIVIFILLTLPLISFISNTILASMFNKSTERIKNDINSYETVYFLRSPEEKGLSHFVSSGDEKEQFSSLFLAFQRLGFFVRENKNISEVLGSNIKLLVITDPSAIKNEDLPLLDEFIFGGGRVLLLYKENKFEVYARIFNFFGIVYRPYIQSVRLSEKLDNGDNIDYQYISYLPVGSSIPQIHSVPGIGNIRLDTYEFNEGSFNILFSAELFDNISLGDPGNPATEEQIRQHEILYDLLEFMGKGF